MVGGRRCLLPPGFGYCQAAQESPVPKGLGHVSMGQESLKELCCVCEPCGARTCMHEPWPARRAGGLGLGQGWQESSEAGGGGRRSRDRPVLLSVCYSQRGTHPPPPRWRQGRDGLGREGRASAWSAGGMGLCSRPLSSESARVAPHSQGEAEEGGDGACQSPLTPLGRTLGAGLRSGCCGCPPGWGKSQQGPFCVGLAGNGSETLTGSGFGMRGFVGGT